MDLLIDHLRARGHRRATTYLENARDHLFGHLELWLQTGIVAPRTTSIVENIIRELVRRLKKVGWNWSDRGAMLMGRIVLIRRYSPMEWHAYWQRRLNLRDRCTIRLVRFESLPFDA